VYIHVHRGELDEAEAILERFRTLETSDEMQARAFFLYEESLLRKARGELQEALGLVEASLEAALPMGLTFGAVREAMAQTVDCALRLGDVAKAEEVLSVLDGARPGNLSPGLRGESARLRARIEAAKGHEEDVDRGFRTAVAEFRAIPVPFAVAYTSLEHAEWLIDRGRSEEAEPLLAEAAQIFEGLRARPWIDRAAEARARLQVPQAVTRA
jgi:tetratricopeptide (TPR) repeat protein